MKKQQTDAELSAGRDASIQSAKSAIGAELVEQDRAKAQKMLFEAKRENVALQLEAAYREQLLQVYQEVMHFVSHFQGIFKAYCLLISDQEALGLSSRGPERPAHHGTASRRRLGNPQRPLCHHSRTGKGRAVPVRRQPQELGQEQYGPPVNFVQRTSEHPLFF